jgi:hypothetical protein
MPAKSASAHAHCHSGDLTTSSLLPSTIKFLHSLNQPSPIYLAPLLGFPTLHIDPPAPPSVPSAPSPRPGLPATPDPSPSRRLNGKQENPPPITRGGSSSSIPDYPGSIVPPLCPSPPIVQGGNVPSTPYPPITRGGSSDYPGRILRLPGEDPPITRGGSSDYPGRKLFVSDCAAWCYFGLTVLLCYLLYLLHHQGTLLLLFSDP